AQRTDQLVQEQRHAVVNLRFGGRWNGPRCHFGTATPDDVVSIYGDELVERNVCHGPTVRRLNRYALFKKAQSKSAKIFVDCVCEASRSVLRDSPQDKRP